jgi:hypothetical protein
VARNDKTMTGIAGELLAASKLSERGYIAAPTLKNTARIDILVSDGEAARMVQVKTSGAGKADWLCPLPETVNDNLVYIFVNLRPACGGPPEFHIVPSRDVRRIVAAGSKAYAAAYQKKHGKPWNPDGDKKGVSHFKDEAGSYKCKWELLGLKDHSPGVTPPAKPARRKRK